ncbi:MAG: hypothetical protein ACOZJX_05270 [Pseudomonadota bacterium]
MADTIVVIERETELIEILETPAVLEIVAAPAPEVIEIVDAGPQGPRGQPGPPGPPGGDLSTEFTQASAQAIWTIDHELGKYPSVTVVDSAGDTVEGAVSYPSIGRVIVRFSAAFAGTAYLN